MVRPVGPDGLLRRTNVHLSERQLSALAKLAKKDGETVAEHVRRAIDAYLEKH